MFKTIWQPVPRWDIPIKELDRAKYPIRRDEFKRVRPVKDGRSNSGTRPKPEMRIWMFENV